VVAHSAGAMVLAQHAAAVQRGAETSNMSEDGSALIAPTRRKSSNRSWVLCRDSGMHAGFLSSYNWQTARKAIDLQL